MHMKLLTYLGHLEKMTEREVFDGVTGKDYGLDGGLPNGEANDRLLEIEMDDRDLISRLGIQGKPRLYGFRQAHEFWAVWWDPEHEIWPSQKRNT